MTSTLVPGSWQEQITAICGSPHIQEMHQYCRTRAWKYVLSTRVHDDNMLVQAYFFNADLLTIVVYAEDPEESLATAIIAAMRPTDTRERNNP